MRILVVDDLLENRYLLEQLLRAKGHQIVCAGDGVEAWDKLGGSDFDLIISDIMMPRMDGFELCYNVKSDPRLTQIPFIFYTATYTADDDKAFALSLGAAAFILKPQEPDAFVHSLDDVLANTPMPSAALLAALKYDQVAFLKGYNERLITKLHVKVAEAREANEKLTELNRELGQRVQEKTQELERSNRELQSFAYTLTHDLRSPLRTIDGYAAALLESAGNRLTEEEQRYLARIVSAANRMGVLIQDMLDYSALGADVTCERVDVEPVVRDIAEAHSSLRGRVEIITPLYPMIAHEASLGQAISNLLVNAVKFVAPGTEPHVCVRSEKRNGDARLWIEDNGIGIAPEHQARLFRLFERFDPHYEGTGIGLAIVARALERMGGTLGVESELGKGSRFWLQLPSLS